MPEPSVGCDVGAAATVVVPSLAVGVAEPLSDAVAPGDGVGLAERLGDALAEGRLDADPVDPGVAPRVVGDVDRGVASVTLVGLVAGLDFFVGAEVARGLLVVGAGFLVVGAGLLVAAAAGGATRGCCPDPKRNPTTVPGAGLKLATPVEL